MADESNAPVEPKPPDGVAVTAKETPSGDVLLRDLAILPPRQQTTTSTAAEAVLALPPLRASEPVQSLRGALSEVEGYAHITRYRFELEERKNDGSTKKNDDHHGTKERHVISPFTGKNAMIVTPLQSKDDDSQAPVILDEFGDLTPLLQRGLKDGSGFRIVLERYDAASVKDHVASLRSLLAGNAPAIDALVEEKLTAQEDIDDEQENADAKQQGGDDAPTKQGDETAAAGEGAPKNLLPDLITYNSHKEAVVDGSNTRDFFYLACGEDPGFLLKDSDSKSRRRKKNKPAKLGDSSCDELEDASRTARDFIPRWNQLEEAVRVKCVIQYSGFHPPPGQRRLMGDLAYFAVRLPSEVLQVTATTMGFYVNRTDGETFDPSPASEHHYSHAMLDCLLGASASFRTAWTRALDAARERAELTSVLTQRPFSTLFRVANRGDFNGLQSAATAWAATAGALDASTVAPSWLVPIPRKFATVDQKAWTHNQFHAYSLHRADDDLQNTFGVDLRSGAIRDWNEELQLAREMPTNTLDERLDRARLIHKVMTQFGEASMLGVKAISEGQIAPMNPSEPARSYVYLHNNIFFSRGVDSGPETFKFARGDGAARKASNKDVQCVGTFHRIEKIGVFTLATVLIDYLGNRFVCQSILPGIMASEKSHQLLYGAVEVGAPLKWDEDLHRVLEEKIGEGMMVATRPLLRNPLTAERLEEVKQLQSTSARLSGTETKKVEKQELPEPEQEVLMSCIPLEAKGILGSDKRRYVLDLNRLTPRDANWVPESKGGTGKFESLHKSQNGKASKKIPSTLEDEEWTMSVFRPELITRFTHVQLAKYIQARKQNGADAKNENNDLEKDEAGEEKQETDVIENELAKADKQNGETTPSGKLTEDDLAYLKTIRFNLNVFLPNVRSFEGIDELAAKQIQADEQQVRDIGTFLWDSVLPSVTKLIRDGTAHQVPVDGKSLTAFLHRNGVNCRYFGRLASLAKEQEDHDAKCATDLKQGKQTYIERKLMPKYWLELLECEMVARVAKHVLDDYLSENGGAVASQPAQTIASFLSALVSEVEETAAQTETRLEKRASYQPDDDDLAALTLTDIGGGGDAVLPPVRSRSDVWDDIENEVGRRFRYSLFLFNNGNKANRALYLPLLRRVCQRSGIRLVAKQYAVGGKCLCGGGRAVGGGGRLFPSFPVSPLDVADILPLMKHCAAYNESFIPCSFGPSVMMPALQVSLQDARVTLERAHIQANSRALAKALELATEAATLYRKVTDSSTHPGVIESMELMASILLEAGDPVSAAFNCSKALGLSIQSNGFDSANVISLHMTLFQMLYAAHALDAAAKHLRAFIYLLELMSGPRHIELYTSYHKLGYVYSYSDYEGKYAASALHFFREAQNRENSDRLMDGFIAKNCSKALETLELYKDALEEEKKAYKTFILFLTKDHQLTKESDESLQRLTKLAVEKDNKLRVEVAVAEALQLNRSSEEDKKRKKKKKKQGKK